MQTIYPTVTTQHLMIPDDTQDYLNKTHCAVLGIGNTILGDEGAGVHVVERLRDKYRFSPEVALINGGCGGLNLYFILERFDSVIIVDALPPGTAPPGSTRIVSDLFTGSFMETCTAHSVGIKETLLLLKSLSAPPGDLILIGIAPIRVDYSLELSSTIQQSLFRLEEVILEQLRFRNIEVTPDE